MNSQEEKLKHQLDKRVNQGNLRGFRTPDHTLIDFSSNDYLGLACNKQLKEKILKNYQYTPEAYNGSTGSRLLTGNTNLVMALEERLAKFFQTPKALVFNSGYTANLSFFATVPQKGDTILYDELIHACIKDGCRLSTAKRYAFRHNDLNDLERKLQLSNGEKYVAVESVYSMDGDFAPLEALVTLCEKYDAKLIVDEAHSTGIWGAHGNGLADHLGLGDRVYAKIYTFGKAMGIHGACIAGSETLIHYLINFARPFIYTTAPSPFELISINSSFSFLRENEWLPSNLHKKITLFKSLIKVKDQYLIKSESPIQAIKVPGNQQVKEISDVLLQDGFDVRPILSPTVKPGEERLRICLHTFNSDQEIDDLCSLLNSHLPCIR